MLFMYECCRLKLNFTLQYRINSLKSVKIIIPDIQEISIIMIYHFSLVNYYHFNLFFVKCRIFILKLHHIYLVFFINFVSVLIPIIYLCFSWSSVINIWVIISQEFLIWLISYLTYTFISTLPGWCWKLIQIVWLACNIACGTPYYDIDVYRIFLVFCQ